MHHAVHPDTAETSVRVAPPKGGNPTLDLIHACKDTKLNKAINDKHNRCEEATRVIGFCVNAGRDPPLHPGRPVSAATP